MFPNDTEIRQITEEIFSDKGFNPERSWIVQWLEEHWSWFLEKIGQFLEPVVGIQVSPAWLEVIGYLLLLVLVLLVAFGIYKGIGRLRFNKVDQKIGGHKADTPSWVEEAEREAEQGNYRDACAYLFRAVLADLQEQGYAAPFQVFSTRGILSELEALNYSYMGEFAQLCNQFNFLFYGLADVDERSWLSFLQQGRNLLNRGGGDAE